MQFHYTVISPYELEVTKERLERLLQEEGFGVLWHFNVSEKLREKGLSFSEALHVLEVCNPVEAHNVLSQTMMASYFLPCKMVVYTEREQVHVGMPKPTALISMLDHEELKQAALGIEQRLAQIIDQAVQ